MGFSYIYVCVCVCAFEGYVLYFKDTFKIKWNDLLDNVTKVLWFLPVKFEQKMEGESRVKGDFVGLFLCKMNF